MGIYTSEALTCSQVRRSVFCRVISSSLSKLPRAVTLGCWLNIFASNVTTIRSGAQDDKQTSEYMGSLQVAGVLLGKAFLIDGVTAQILRRNFCHDRSLP
jgi:hypothetical protein